MCHPNQHIFNQTNRCKKIIFHFFKFRARMPSLLYLNRLETIISLGKNEEINMMEWFTFLLINMLKCFTFYRINTEFLNTFSSETNHV